MCYPSALYFEAVYLSVEADNCISFQPSVIPVASSIRCCLCIDVQSDVDSSQNRPSLWMSLPLFCNFRIFNFMLVAAGIRGLARALQSSSNRTVGGLRW